MMNPRRFLIPLLTICTLLFPAPARAAGAETETDHSSTSPDERWEYRLIEAASGFAGEEVPVIVKAGTTKVVGKPPKEAAAPAFVHQTYVVWSPDSRRLAFNYRVGGRYYTTALYQLRAGKWEALRSPVAPETTQPLEPAMDVQAKKAKLPKAAFWRRINDSWTLQRWVNANTAELHVSSTKLAPEQEVGLKAHFLFTLRFDTRGHWTVVQSRALTDQESEAMDAE